MSWHLWNCIINLNFRSYKCLCAKRKLFLHWRKLKHELTLKFRNFRDYTLSPICILALANNINKRHGKGSSACFITLLWGVVFCCCFFFLVLQLAVLSGVLFPSFRIAHFLIMFTIVLDSVVDLADFEVIYWFFKITSISDLLLSS